MPRPDAIPTTTLLVQQALEAADDFVSAAMLCKATGRNANQVSAALHHLRKHRVADVVVQPDGGGWWFACRDDDRTALVEMRVPEDKPRRRRRRNPLKEQP